MKSTLTFTGPSTSSLGVTHTAACGTASESETDGTPQGHTRRGPRHDSSTRSEPTGFRSTAALPGLAWRPLCPEDPSPRNASEWTGTARPTSPRYCSGSVVDHVDADALVLEVRR